MRASNDYMVTLCKNVSAHSKHACNFYHSQVRIIIECAFGMLAYRHEILRSTMIVRIPLKKEISLTCCLRKLHNCCVSESDLEHCEQAKIDSIFSSVSSSMQIEGNASGNHLLIDIADRGEY